MQAPRSNKKATKIAWSLLGKPTPLQKKLYSKKTEEHQRALWSKQIKFIR